MKNLILTLALSLVSAQAFASYTSNPTFCRADWKCEIVSTSFHEASAYCAKVPFTLGTAAVYEYAAGSHISHFKGYGCLDSSSASAQ